MSEPKGPTTFGHLVLKFHALNYHIHSAQSVSCLTPFPTTYGDNSAFVQDYSRHLFAGTSRNLPSLRTYRGPNK